MTIWQPDLDGRTGPKFKQIADAIGDDIARGRLAIGDRLPVQRDLAYALDLSLNTVSRAYTEAMERGLLRGEVGRGTYVRTSGPLTVRTDPAEMVRPENGPIDFSLNLPAPGKAAGILAQTLTDLGSTDTLASFLDYQDADDSIRHRRAGADWLSRVGVSARSRTTLVTNGAQHGVMTALMATTRPGDVLLTERLTYGPILALARHLGLKIVPVSTDDRGLSPHALDTICEKIAASALYCLPTINTPTTATMDGERRAELVSVARKHDLVIIEDDVFGMLPVERPLPVACLAPERTVYVTSVSKSLAPGLRVGYVHAPDRLVGSLRAAITLSCWMPPPLMAEIASRWIEDGTADALNGHQREEATARQALARTALPADALRAHPNGFHVWLALPAHWQPDAFRRAAEQRGVKLLPGDVFSVDRTAATGAVRLCLSHESASERVTRGLATIAGLLDEPGDTGSILL